MNTNQLKRFAKEARIKLLDQVGRKLEFVLANKSQSFIDTYATELANLKNKVQKAGKEQVIEMVAYTWFNRLMAFRFMDANGYTIPKVVTPQPGMTNPEILQNALGGNIEPELHLDRKRLSDLFDGKTAAIDAHTEAYKMLLVASCNQWHSTMPFMFERISDYTELLLPDDLLSDYSIVADIRNGMSDEDCRQEELIGWLYQFYISDKKDDVFEGLKKNIKITAENIPAATQLFTPHWIVRYMVENTLGKFWLTFKPDSKLKKHMPYFIEAPEGNAPSPLPDGIKGVTDITFLDPCQGSGHVLVYAFDLFTKIYEEEGYNTNEIPALILQHNLFGIDIDERAAQLAAFALTMKARSYYTRFLRKPMNPHVIALENVSEDIIKQAVKIPLAVAGKLVYDYRDLSLYLLTQADNFGSLIQIDHEELRALQIQKGSLWQEQELKMLQQAEYLSRQYHCVVTNPPYMGTKGMNSSLNVFVESFYPTSKYDLFASFMDRCSDFIPDYGYYSMINQNSWMFLSSYDELRYNLLKNETIKSLIHLGPRTFPEISGEVVQSVSFVIEKVVPKNQNSVFVRLVDVKDAFQKEVEFNKSNRYYFIDQQCFDSIPGKPIAYWVHRALLEKFISFEKVDDYIHSDGQNKTGNNEKYVRFFWEVPASKIGVNKKYILYAKGGTFRKWYGNIIHVVDWSDESRKFYRSNNIARIIKDDLWYKPGFTFSRMASTVNVRCLDIRGTFDATTVSFYTKESNSDLFKTLLAFFNSKIVDYFISILNPTLVFQLIDIQKIPFFGYNEKIDESLVDRALDISKDDWDSSEQSFDFASFPLLRTKSRTGLLKEKVIAIHEKLKEVFFQLKIIEEDLNKQFIRIYELDDVINPEVPLGKVSILQEEAKIVNDDLYLDPNPLLLQLISYLIGCIFGRYSIDKPGLILANQGETLQDFLKQVPNPTFIPDEDNIIPVLEGEWFVDDIVVRFKVFLKAAFGEEHFEENLKYLEDTIGKDIRKYFVKDFYNDHIKRYKKRPIYWMFSSPKGHFKALIYMHRYQPDLCSKLLNDYLLAFISKLEAAKQTQVMFSLREDISTREKNAALNEIDKLEQMLRDCHQYEKTLFTIATQKISIDLDDGVKVNYQKFKEVLVPIKGLEKEEE